MVLLYSASARNNFSLLTGHVSFQTFLLVRHFSNSRQHNLTDNTSKKITRNVLVRVLVRGSVIVFNHIAKLAGHFQNLVRQCPVTDYYFSSLQCCTFKL